MTEQLDLEIIRPDALRPHDRAAWEAIRAADPALDHPYLDPRFALAAADVPGAAVAVFRRAEAAVAFFPFQRRGRLIQPLGAPLSDYHGVVAAPADRLTPDALARRLGGTLRVGGWIVSPVEAPGFVRKARMATDVTGGRQALCDRLEARSHRFFKNMRRLGRGFERDHGAPVFAWDDRDPAVLEWIVGHKRAQYRRTRRHDVFACGWTVDLLRRLHAMHPDGFGVRVTSLRKADGTLVAAEASLDDRRTLHLWFPTYDPAFSAYGPGTLLTRRELEQAAEDGYSLVDFGAGEEGYKSALSEPSGAVFEGAVRSGGPDLAGLAERMLASGPAPVRRFQQSLGRRFDIINACETRAADWWAGAAGAAAAAARKTLGASA
ncbi:GNAT family N-acetyltransferase [Brevundimonas viscosa]|uniref:Acetyltransferase involved in cellulose biosynthesis, CelD/BcsL family n=1 Tax=Brevundimonas viscosa TaxID=871741 RepID=A0A1I6RWY6_9CAUL|nr:GNAT family N-acetyltransferase [Brevundimonas viscosa]SFS69202.1 Acetyltransferase involved in cellulose biosynthesis, CelD/BcsL family [Brevundimonas viscosa]